MSSTNWFVAGRLLIAQGAVDACKVGTAIAIRYSCNRPQFGEKMIMEYITQQRRLLPGLATTYAMQVSMMRLRVRFIITITSTIIQINSNSSSNSNNNNNNNNYDDDKQQ